MLQGFVVLDITWTDMKSFTTRDSFTLYYVSEPNGAYEVIGVSRRFIYRTWLSSSSDISDFTTNYLGAAITTPAIDDMIGSNNLYGTTQIRDSSGNPVNAVNGNLFTQQASAPTVDSVETGWIFSALTTSTITPDQIVLTYTVPTGKTFYVMYHEVVKATVNSVGAEPAKLLVNGVEKARVGMPGGNLNTVVYPTALYVGFPLAFSGDTITVTVTPGGNPVTIWCARFLGAIK